MRMPVYVCLLVFEFVYVSCPYACIDLMCVCVCVCARARARTCVRACVCGVHAQSYAHSYLASSGTHLKKPNNSVHMTV